MYTQSNKNPSVRNFLSPGNTQHSQKTDIHATGGIRTQNLSNCIMEIHSFRTVDETDYLLLVMVKKGG
jgi:hypothetical protein